MSTKRVFGMGAVAGLVAILGYGIVAILTTAPKSTTPAREVTMAIERFSAEHRSVPATVTATELISRGYLSPATLKDFGAAEITVHFPKEGNPQEVLIDALMQDGSHSVLLGDGSVQFARNGPPPM